MFASRGSAATARRPRSDRLRRVAPKPSTARSISPASLDVDPSHFQPDRGAAASTAPICLGLAAMAGSRACQSRSLGTNLVQQLQPLRHHAAFRQRDAGELPPVDSGWQRSRADRVPAGHEYYRHRRGRLAATPPRRTAGHDHCARERTNPLQRRQSIESFSAQRYSIVRSGPRRTDFLQALAKRRTRARIRTVRGAAEYPITGIRSACCARAASGHAAAAPPSVNMNSRRRMWIAMRPLPPEVVCMQ